MSHNTPPSRNGSNSDSGTYGQVMPQPDNGQFKLPQDAVVIVATTTPDKVHDLNLIAQAHGSGLRFVPLCALTEWYHSAPEEQGTFKGNAHEKILEAVYALHKAYAQDSSGFKSIMSHYGIPFDKGGNRPLYIATEDSGFSLDLTHEQLERLDKTGFGKYAEVFEKAIASHDSFSFPGADTKQIMEGCGGIRRLMQRVHDVLPGNKQQLPMTGHSILQIAKITPDIITDQVAGSPSRRTRPLWRSVHNKSYIPKIVLNTPIEGSAAGTADFSLLQQPHHFADSNCSDHFFRPGGSNENASVLDDERYLYTVTHSARADMFNKLATQSLVGNGKWFTNKTLVPEGIFASAPAGVSYPRSSLTAGLNSSYYDLKKFKANLMYATASVDPGSTEHLLQALAKQNGVSGIHVANKFDRESMLRGIQSLRDVDTENCDKSDAFVLMPISDSSRQQDHDTSKETASNIPPTATLLRQLYLLSSRVVAKQLEGKSWDKPIVMLNSDGSWTRPTAILADMMDRGLCGGKIGTKPLREMTPSIERDAGESSKKLYPTYDVRNFVELCDTPEQVADFLRWKRYNYLPIKPLDLPQGIIRYKKVSENGDVEYPALNTGQTIGEAKPDKYSVAVFCSAGSENAANLDTASDLSYTLARNGYGVVFGAGDRYMMGAVLNGVLEWRKQYNEAPQRYPDMDGGYIAGSSTPIILGRETKRGGVPDGMDYFHLAPDIYQRMEFMARNCDAIVVLDGGPGTLQELSGLMLMRELEAEKIRGGERAPKDGWLMHHENGSPKRFVLCNRAMPGEQRGCLELVLQAFAGRETLDPQVPLTGAEKHRLINDDITVVDTAQEAFAAVEHYRAQEEGKKTRHYSDTGARYMNSNGITNGTVPNAYARATRFYHAPVKWPALPPQ